MDFKHIISGMLYNYQHQTYALTPATHSFCFAMFHNIASLTRATYRHAIHYSISHYLVLLPLTMLVMGWFFLYLYILNTYDINIVSNRIVKRCNMSKNYLQAKDYYKELRRCASSRCTI